MKSVRLEAKLIYFKLEETVRRRFRRFLHRMVVLGLSHPDTIRVLEFTTVVARFEQEHMQGCPAFPTLMKHCANALDHVTLEGLHLEFGTFRGKSMNMIANMRPNTIFYCFDSFEGLPEKWHIGVEKGTFDIGGNVPDLRDNVVPVKGWFDESVPVFAKEHAGEQIAFMHVDCDLYSSTKVIFEHLGDMIKPGAVIVFDEYLTVPADGDCEYKAYMEFLEPAGLDIEYIGQIRGHNQIATRVIAKREAE